MTNKQHLTQENLELAKKGKLYERNRISPNSSTKQRHKNHHIKARIDKMQQNSKCRLCGDRDETINHIINECKKISTEKSIRVDTTGWVR